MKIVTMGEIMLRLSPEGNRRFIQADRFEAAYGGAEANVAVLLAQLGEDACFVTRLPKHGIGQAAAAELRKFGVRTDYVACGGERIGIYFLEKGISQRPSSVIYDRQHSSFSEACAEDFDFDKIFKDCGWFHFTGITPALSDGAANLTARACRQAHGAGIPVSCDINYRSSLWTKERAGEILSPLMKFVDVCITNPEQVEDVFGICAQTKNGPELESITDIAAQLEDRFGFKKIAFTGRKNTSASDNILFASLYSRGQCCYSREYPVHIADRVGGGDAFAAGLIYGITHNFEDGETVEFASAANALKHTVEGDFCLAGLDEITALAKGGGQGRIKR